MALDDTVRGLWHANLPHCAGYQSTGGEIEQRWWPQALAYGSLERAGHSMPALLTTSSLALVPEERVFSKIGNGADVQPNTTHPKG
jgi:hypothetical protein